MKYLRKKQIKYVQDFHGKNHGSHIRNKMGLNKWSVYT